MTRGTAASGDGERAVPDGAARSLHRPFNDDRSTLAGMMMGNSLAQMF